MLRISLQRFAQHDTLRSIENPHSLTRIQYQRPLGLGVGLDARFVVCCSPVSVLSLPDVRLDSRLVVLAVSVASSPVASTVSLVFLATVSPVSLVFSPTV